MSQSPGSPSPIDDLQFNTVEPVASASAPAPAAMACFACKQPLRDIYFAVNDKVICGNCCAQITAPPRGNGALRFAKAAIYGVGAALASAAVLFAVIKMAHVLLAIAALGYVIAKAMRKGSGGQGGLQYQVLAVILTYSSVVFTYIAMYLDFFYKERPGMVLDGRMLYVAATNAVVAPFLDISSGQNIFWLIVIGIAMVQAWKMMAARKLPISGPFQVGPRAPIAMVSGVKA